MADIPSVMVDKGPVPGYVIISLKAEEDMTEGTVVTFGTAERTCAKAGATDFLLGWIAGNASEDEMVAVHLTVPMWKSQLSDDSEDVTYGDTLELTSHGKIRRGVVGSSHTIAGKAMNDGEADEFIDWIPTICCPSATAVS